MIHEGQIVLFAFPLPTQLPGKLRPALVLRRVPGPYNDWLICMISSQLHEEVPGFDELLRPSEPDFAQTGLKMPSVVRAARLAVVVGDALQGAIGTLEPDRLKRIRARLSRWIEA